MSLPDFQPGFRVGRYELLAPIASGGMASVWAARMRGPRGFKKLVAIKTILPHLANDPQFETMFLDEARIASEIVHPNIAQVFDLGEQDGVLYLVSEWIDGETLAMLRRRVEERGDEVPVPVALRLMGDVCAGLHAAHELRDDEGRSLEVVHRDVSPQNIVVSDAGAVKVIDFGVAKALHRALGQTVAGKLKGKVKYMAPEQARGLQVDRRADIWSVGAVLYHLLAGRVPYDADNPLAVLDRLLARTPPPTLPSHVPISVSQIVMKALQHEPNDRYQTATDMQMAIGLALRDVSMPVTDAAITEYVAAYLGAQARERHKVVSRALQDAEKAPSLPPDLTLVEYVTRGEGKALSAPPPTPPAPERPEWDSHGYDPPTVRPPEPAESIAPDPVPLVRRSQGRWEDHVDPRGLDELRSMVAHTLPENRESDAGRDLAPGTDSPESPSSPAPPTSAAKHIPIVAGLVAAAATAGLLAWATLPGDRGEQPTTASPPASVPPAHAAVPEAGPDHAVTSTPVVSAAPPASSSSPAAAASPPKRDAWVRPARTEPRPASTVPPPPPGWRDLPSITTDPDSEEEPDTPRAPSSGR